MIAAFLLCVLNGAEPTSSAGHSSKLAHVHQTGKPVVRGTVHKQPGKPAILETEERNQLNLHELEQIVYLDPPERPSSQPNFAIRWSSTELLTGDVVMLDAEFATVRSAIGEVKMPRSELVEIRNQEVGRLLESDSFGSDLAGRSIQGTPTLSRDRFVSAPASLKLDEPGQSVQWRQNRPVERGRVRFSFFGPASVDGKRRFTVRLTGTETTVTFRFADHRSYYTAELPKSWKIGSMAIRKSAGWHAVSIEWSRDWLVASVDGAALVSSFQAGIADPPSQVSFTLEADQGDRSEPSEPFAVWVDDFSWVTLPSWYSPGLESRPQPVVAATTNTQIVMLNGDEWFGTVVDADAKRLQLQVGDGHLQPLDWSDVFLVRFPPRTLQPASESLEGEIGELQLHSGARLIVALRSTADDRWVIQHPLFGERTVALGEIRCWTPKLLGRRVAISKGGVHLGDKFVAEFERPYPDQLSVTLPFDSDPQAMETRLCVSVRGMEAEAPWAPFESVLKAGGLRTEVWLNGKKADYLNRHLPASGGSGDNVSVPLDPSQLNPGRNQVELRLQPDPASGVYDESEVSSIVIEQVLGAANLEGSK